MEQYIPGRTFSERMDAEWYRLITCHGTTTAPNPLSRNRFAPSALVGSWRGTVIVRLSILHLQFKPVRTDSEPNRIQVPKIVEFTGFLHSDQPQDPRKVPLNYLDAQMELHEYHYLGDGMPLTAGRRVGEVGDDPLSAWIPQGTKFVERHVSLLCSLLHISFCLRTASPLSRGRWRDGALRN